MKPKPTFPQPWHSVWCGDAYRVYDANDRQLFVISVVEYDDEEGEEQQTVLAYGSDEESNALHAEIGKLWPEKQDD